MKKITILPAALGLVLLGLAAPNAHAQLVLTLTPAGQAGAQPGVFQFIGTLSNPSSSDVTLGGDSETFNGPGGMSAIDDSPFFDNAPSDLEPGDMYTGGFFNVTIPAGTPDDEYDGTFDITDDSGNTVGSSDFSVTVIGPAATPEPSAVTGLTLGVLGLSALALRARKRRSA